MDVFLMSPPRADWRVHGKANPFSQARTSPVEGAGLEAGAALREWLALADAITAAGGHVVVVPPPEDPSLTGMPYTAEAGLLGALPDESARVFLLPTMKSPHRLGEAALIERTVASWGLKVRSVPVLWEGQGDVIDVGPATGARFVCTSGEGPQARTSAEAYAHVAPFIPGDTLHVRFRADPWFHGNTFLARFHSAQENVVVVCEHALLDGELARLRAFVPEARFVAIGVADSLRYGTNALQVGTRVLAPQGAPESLLTLWSSLGLEVVPLVLPALFGRGGGAAVCLTNRIAMSAEDVPVASRYSSVRQDLVAASSRA